MGNWVQDNRAKIEALELAGPYLLINSANALDDWVAIIEGSYMTRSEIKDLVSKQPVAPLGCATLTSFDTVFGIAGGYDGVVARDEASASLMTLNSRGLKRSKEVLHLWRNGV